MRHYLLLLFFFCTSAFCDLKDPYVLAVTEGEPSANIADCVNAITGDFFISQEDVIVSGTEPIRLQRCYISGNGRGPYAGWFSTLNPLLTYFPVMMQTKEPCGLISVSETTGTLLTFSAKCGKHCKDKKKRHPGIFR